MRVNEVFGSMVFNDDVMRERLPKHIYRSLRSTIKNNTPLNEDVADVVAAAMKDWAIEKGATHYTHWFQPMTGTTAEKHDSFISPVDDSHVIMEFSGKELVKGEPDASSFPSGGLRATFEARGYTAWDPTSPAFVKGGSLFIPTAFCSYTGEVLDKKTPLLRSMEVVNTHALRILRLFGNTTAHRVTTTVGAEQEYFLIDREDYLARKDLLITGRTLFGAKPPKGQELEDHYFGSISERVAAYMKELDEELWKLGVTAKTKHCEAAPAQFELAPIFATSNIACDHNQLVMEYMRKVAAHHGLACLLHEKPFAGVNGSGKHNNWSISTDDGQNLLEPGNSPEENAQFLLFLCAVIEAVDDYAELIRLSVATAGNDHRLGASEAPPAIMSIYLGDQLTNILESLEKGVKSDKVNAGVLEVGVNSLPVLPKDTTDRNRTSPFAFTGNKFEFRMPGSSISIAGPNIILNTAIGEVLSKYADRLEAADDFISELNALLRDVVHEHKRVIFNGNNYSDEWAIEAEKRGLVNLKTSIDAIPLYVLKKNIDVLVKHKIFSEEEIHSRCEILLEDYSKCINIEALTMLDIAKRDITPAVIAYSKLICETLAAKKSLNMDIDCHAEEVLATKISKLSAAMIDRINTLEAKVIRAKGLEGVYESAKYYRDGVFAEMQGLRAVVDELETLVGDGYWPMPTYTKLLFEG